MTSERHDPNVPSPDPGKGPLVRATFRKEERLCGRLRIQEVVGKGRSVHVPPFKLVGRIMELPTPASAQVAFAVPKRNIRSAVARNRVRRLMREAYRLNKSTFHAALASSGKQCAWLFVYQGRGPLDLQEAQEKITRSMGRWMKEHG